MSDKVKVVIILSILVALDFLVVGGLLWHGKANFHELIKHLKK